MTEEKQDKLIRINEAAELLSVHPETLRRWDREGKLNAITINERGDRRYSLKEINQYIEKMRLT